MWQVAYVVAVEDTTTAQWFDSSGWTLPNRQTWHDSFDISFINYSHISTQLSRQKENGQKINQNVPNQLRLSTTKKYCIFADGGGDNHDDSDDSDDSDDDDRCEPCWWWQLHDYLGRRQRYAVATVAAVHTWAHISQHNKMYTTARMHDGTTARRHDGTTARRRAHHHQWWWWMGPATDADTSDWPVDVKIIPNQRNKTRRKKSRFKKKWERRCNEQFE